MKYAGLRKETEKTFRIVIETGEALRDRGARGVVAKYLIDSTGYMDTSEVKGVVRISLSPAFAQRKGISVPVKSR